MSSFFDELRRAIGIKVPGKVRHYSDFTEEEKAKYRSMLPKVEGSDTDSNAKWNEPSDEDRPGFAWSLIEGTNTLYDGVPGDIRVIKRIPMGGEGNPYADGGDTDDVTVDDVVTGMVIRGMYGDGEDRKERLYKDGFNYNRVMKRVNDAYKNGRQDYYGKLTDRYGIKYKYRRGAKYAGGQQYYIPDDYVDTSR